MSYLGQEIPKLGFGLMRLPKNGEEIDIEQTKQMVDKFLAAGFTYFDTAWAYAGSEDAIRQALVERYPRESYQLATKNAAWINCKTREEAIDQFETSLKRTGAGYFDFYLLHNLGEHRTKFFEDYDMWNFVLQKKAEGKIRHVGFSFHDKAEVLEEILNAHPEAEFVQLQINYADWESTSVESRKCYETARRHNKPVIIMEPVKGGLLANPPEPVKEVFREAMAASSVTPADCAAWALHFAADLDGLIAVLSGMSSLEQMEDNLKAMKGFTHLTPGEKATLAKAQEAMAGIPLIQCTTCNYCAKVCPMEVAISGTFTVLNNLTLYQNEAAAKRAYYFATDQRYRKHASDCIKCGACEEVCPQHLPIRELLEQAAAKFDA